MVTFKREKQHPNLGFIPPRVILEFNGRECGLLIRPWFLDKEQLWRVQFMMTSKRGSWCWEDFGRRFTDETAAREYVQANIERIESMYELYYFDQD